MITIIYTTQKEYEIAKAIQKLLIHTYANINKVAIEKGAKKLPPNLEKDK